MMQGIYFTNSTQKEEFSLKFVQTFVGLGYSIAKLPVLEPYHVGDGECYRLLNLLDGSLDWKLRTDITTQIAQAVDMGLTTPGKIVYSGQTFRLKTPYRQRGFATSICGFEVVNSTSVTESCNILCEFFTSKLFQSLNKQTTISAELLFEASQQSNATIASVTTNDIQSHLPLLAQPELATEIHNKFTKHFDNISVSFLPSKSHFTNGNPAISNESLNYTTYSFCLYNNINGAELAKGGLYITKKTSTPITGLSIFIDNLFT